MTTTTTTTTLPAGLDEMAPGPELAAALDGIDVNRLSGHDQVIVLRAQQPLVSHHQAHTYAGTTPRTPPTPTRPPAPRSGPRCASPATPPAPT